MSKRKQTYKFHEGRRNETGKIIDTRADMVKDNLLPVLRKYTEECRDIRGNQEILPKSLSKMKMASYILDDDRCYDNYLLGKLTKKEEAKLSVSLC